MKTEDWISRVDEFLKDAKNQDLEGYFPDLERMRDEFKKNREDIINILMEKYNIEYLGGCSHCQPNGDWADGWGIIPDEIYNLLTEEDSCCEEIDEDGIRVKNLPIFCKYEEEEDQIM